MTKYEKDMENIMGKVNDLEQKYNVSKKEAIALLMLRELDYIDSNLSEIKTTLVDGFESELRSIRQLLEK